MSQEDADPALSPLRKGKRRRAYLKRTPTPAITRWRALLPW